MILENHIQLKNFLKIRFKKSISFRLLYFSDAENERMEIKVNSFINECGCKHGSYFLAIAILIYVTTQIYFTLLLLHNLFFIIGILIFSIIGKFIGIGIARFKLKTEVNKIIEVAQQRIAAHGDIPAIGQG